MCCIYNIIPPLVISHNFSYICPMARDYKDEYKKFQSSPSSIKKRVKLNKINRDKGTYGNNDGKDNSHVKNGDGTVIIVVKNASDNRGSKNDMPGDKRARGGFNAAKGSRVYKNKYFVTAGDDNEFGDNSNVDSSSLRTEKIRKASSGAIYSRGFDYYGGGPLYGQSAGNAAIMGGTNTAAALGAGNDGSGKGGGGGLFGDKRKDAKIKEKGGTTTNERRALRKAKKAVRVASRQEKRLGQEGQIGGPTEHAKKNLALLQTKIQNDTFTANDNVKPWFKSKKSWAKDDFNRINSTQKQKEKWEKANPDKKWEAHGGNDTILSGHSDLKYYTGKKGEEYSFGDGTTRPFSY